QEEGNGPEGTQLPLSPLQQGIWFEYALKQNSSYNVPVLLSLEERPDVAVLSKVLNELIEEHEILRTVFPVIEDRPFQQLLEPEAFHIREIDYAGMSQEEINSKIKEEVNHLFDLGSW